MRYIFAILLLTILANSQIINGIAIKVNNIPITLYDIKKVEQELKERRKNVVQLLIQNALEESEIKRLHLKASDNDIERFILNIMVQNRITSKDAFFQVLSYQGISKSEFLKNAAKQVLKSKLYQKIASSKIVPPTEKELKHFYNSNILKYSFADSYDTTIYISKDLSALKSKKVNPLLFYRNIKVEKRNIISKSINPEIREALSKTKLHTFSEIIKFEDSYALFYIDGINGQSKSNFQDVKNEIANTILLSQQKKIVDSHFKRVRAEAIIEYLR